MMLIIVCNMYHFFRFFSSTFGLNTSKGDALCQAKRFVMLSNRDNQRVQTEAHCDGTPAQPQAIVHIQPC